MSKKILYISTLRRLFCVLDPGWSLYVASSTILFMYGYAACLKCACIQLRYILIMRNHKKCVYIFMVVVSRLTLPFL